MSSSSLTTKTLSKMAVCVAIICISAYISFPITAVPFTCLTLTMLLSAFLSTPKETLIIMIVYTLIGAIGLPVFSGGAGGFNCLFSPTGGYLWGFIVSYPIASYLKGNKNSFKNFFLAGLAVIPITYIFGVAMLAFHFRRHHYWCFTFHSWWYHQNFNCKLRCCSFAQKFILLIEEYIW